MDFYELNDYAKEQIRKYQSSKAPIEPFYAPFYPPWRKHLAKWFYVLASRLEPKHYPSRRLVRK